ncbi:efflux transporter outer membrane subunit OpmH [Halomonas shantousis]
MSQDPSSSIAKFRLLPLLLAVSLASQAQAADLWTITQDALASNAALNSSRATFSSVEEARDVQRGDLLPQVGASGEVAHSETIESQSSGAAGGGAGSSAAGDDRYNSVSAGLEVTQALFDARNYYELKLAEQQIGQQALLLEGDQQSLLYNVAAAYFEILRDKDVLDALVAQEKAIGRQLEQSREQFEVGLIAITDVHEAQATFDLARAQRIAAESDLQVSFEELEELTGRRYESIEGLAEDIPIEPPQPVSRDAWVTMAMENSPVVQAAQEGIDLSRFQVDIARAQHYPTVDAFANYQYSDNDQDALRGHNEGAQVGLSLNWSIFNGGSTLALIRQNTYELEATQYDFESQRRSTTQQVRSLFTLVSNNVQTIEARRQAIVSNRSALEATRSGYEVGTRNIVDVLTAEQNLYNALANYAESRYDYIINLLSLRQQAGILEPEVIQQLNEWLREDQTVSLTLPDGGTMSRGLDDIGARPTPPSS